MGNGPGLSQFSPPQGARGVQGGLAALWGDVPLPCHPSSLPFTLRFSLSPDPLGLKLALRCVVWFLCSEHPVDTTCFCSASCEVRTTTCLLGGRGLRRGKRGKTPSLTLPVPAVVCALQPGALPPVLVSPHHGPAEDARGKRWWAQPELPQGHVQVHPYTLALVGWRWARRTECLSVLLGILCCELGGGQTWEVDKLHLSVPSSAGICLGPVVRACLDN